MWSLSERINLPAAGNLAVFIFDQLDPLMPERWQQNVAHEGKRKENSRRAEGEQKPCGDDSLQKHRRKPAEESRRDDEPHAQGGTEELQQRFRVEHRAWDDHEKRRGHRVTDRREEQL